MFSAGFSTFALLYCVQPLMPLFSRIFEVSPARSSLVLSVTTGIMAVAMLFASSFSEWWGRRRVMVASLVSAAALTCAFAFVEDWHDVVLLRALIGLTISGLPAVAMAYLGEEMHPKAIGLAMGLYISGSAVGGLAGRVLAGVGADYFPWRGTLAAIGVMGLACGVILARSLPPSRNFQKAAPSLSGLARGFAQHLHDGRQRILYALAFLLMGAFVCVYNYVGYRLSAEPYNLSQTAVSLLFSIYLVGIFSSSFMGHLATKLGRDRMLKLGIALMIAGVALTLIPYLPLIVFGMAVLTFGFFGSHAIASAWVAANAAHARGQASALYLFAYYLGSGGLGTLGGFFWSGAGWVGVSALLLGILAVAYYLARAIPTQSSPAACW